MFDLLVDNRLSFLLGEPDPASLAVIDEELARALQWVIGDILAEAPTSAEVLDRIAPWARDLVRGLHWRAQTGLARAQSVDMRSILTQLAREPMAESLRDEAVANIAFVWALTHDRVIDQLHGYQAHKRYTAHDLEQRAPWQADVILGYSIHLILEWLRLDPRTQPPI